MRGSRPCRPSHSCCWRTSSWTHGRSASSCNGATTGRNGLCVRGGSWKCQWDAVRGARARAGRSGGRHCNALSELNEPARAIARAIGARFADHPGAALFLDYGPERSAAGDSLQALRGGRPANPLEAPGTGRSHRPCGSFRSVCQRRQERRGGDPWADTTRRIPHPTGLVPAHRPPGSHLPHRTGRGTD